MHVNSPLVLFCELYNKTDVMVFIIKGNNQNNGCVMSPWVYNSPNETFEGVEMDKQRIESFMSNAPYALGKFFISESDWVGFVGADVEHIPFVVSSDLDEKGVPLCGLYAYASDGEIIVERLNLRQSNYQNFLYFFKCVPQVGEVIIVNSVPRLIVRVSEVQGEMLFSDVSWDYVKGVSDGRSELAKVAVA